MVGGRQELTWLAHAVCTLQVTNHPWSLFHLSAILNHLYFSAKQDASRLSPHPRTRFCTGSEEEPHILALSLYVDRRLNSSIEKMSSRRFYKIMYENIVNIVLIRHSTLETKQIWKVHKIIWRGDIRRRWHCKEALHTSWLTPTVQRNYFEINNNKSKQLTHKVHLAVGIYLRAQGKEASVADIRADYSNQPKNNSKEKQKLLA